MAHVNKRTPTETKYVTLLADARPDVDITFRDAVLTRPTDHYLVGVDNFTLCSSGFSMIEPRLDRNRRVLLRGDGKGLIPGCLKGINNSP